MSYFKDLAIDMENAGLNPQSVADYAVRRYNARLVGLLRDGRQVVLQLQKLPVPATKALYKKTARKARKTSQWYFKLDRKSYKPATTFVLPIAIV
jgi:hypothetical protein